MVGNHISDPDSPKMQSEIHRIYTSKIKEFYSKANQIVEEHRDLLVRIAHLLVERCTLSREELFELYDEMQSA